jgi:immunity protein Imm1 of predicted polymorphic toxin system
LTSLSSLIVTASLTTGIVRVVHGMTAAARLVDEIIETDHVEWETTMSVGTVEFHRTKAGPFPNHQLRISVRPSIGYAALSYMDHDDPQMPIANSYNPRLPRPRLYLVFNGSTGSVFPRAAAVPVVDARIALAEWLETWKRPTCIEWRPFDAY